jgi:hypothetical protein
MANLEKRVNGKEVKHCGKIDAENVRPTTALALSVRAFVSSPFSIPLFAVAFPRSVLNVFVK